MWGRKFGEGKEGDRMGEGWGDKKTEKDFFTPQRPQKRPRS